MGNTVLIIDDNREYGDKLKRELTVYPEFGEILNATGGRTGRDMAARYNVDVIVCEAIMKDGDGFSVVEDILRTSVTKPVIIMVSSFTNGLYMFII